MLETLPDNWIRIGQDLSRARAALAMSVEDVAAETKIPSHCIDAIELGRFHTLSAPIYAVSFACSLARAVDLPDDGIRGDVLAGYDIHRGGFRPSTVGARLFG